MVSVPCVSPVTRMLMAFTPFVHCQTERLGVSRMRHAVLRHAYEVSDGHDERSERASIGCVRIKRIEASLDEGDTIMAPMPEKDRARVAWVPSVPFVEPKRDVVCV